MRIEYKLGKLQGNQLDKDIKEEILKKKHQLRDQAEKEILSRLNALRKHLRTPARDPHISLEEIFRQREKRYIKTLLVPLMSYLRKHKGNQDKSTRLT
jgi:transitional endoplasmic reticulum ATPase